MKNSTVAVLLFLLVAASLHSQDFTAPLQLTTPRTNGADVLAVQTKLLELGFAQVGVADSTFGPLTQQGVSDFQRYAGFLNAGTVDRPTWDALFFRSSEMLKIQDAIKRANVRLKGTFRKSGHDIMDRTTEGGRVDDYFDGNDLAYEIFAFYGELGKGEFQVIYLESGVVVLEKNYKYPEPFDIEHAQISNTAYYFIGELSLKIQEGVITSAKRKDLFFEDLIGKPKS